MALIIATIVFHLVAQSEYKKAVFAQHQQDAEAGLIPMDAMLPGPEAIDAPGSLLIFTVIWLLMVAGSLLAIEELVVGDFHSRMRSLVGSFLKVASPFGCAFLVALMMQAQYDINLFHRQTAEIYVSEVYVEEGAKIEEGARLVDYRMKNEGETQKETISLHAPISGKVTNVKVAPNEEYRFLEELRMMTISGENAEVHIKAAP